VRRTTHVAALLIAAGVAVAGEAAEETFRWPVPEGWKSETIPFPLEFAKDLPYSGVEELRFAPGMFAPDQDGYWSYAFLWWLDGRPALGAAELQDALKRYFAGLITAVAKDKGFPVDPARFSASIQAAPRPQGKLGHDVEAFAGTVDSYDGFKTGAPIVLEVEVWVWDCAAKRAALMLASPKPPTAPIWSLLRQRRDEVACHAPVEAPRP
jgi:hypothetical protein